MKPYGPRDEYGGESEGMMREEEKKADG